MDGVLVDSMEAWFKLFNKTLKHFGKEEFSMDEFLDKVWGGPIERDADDFFGKPVKDVIKFYFDNFDFFKENMKLFPDVKEVLNELKDKKLKLGIVTNTPKKQVDKLVEHLELRDYFDVIVGGDEAEHGKPSPDIILLACERLGIEVKDAVYVGDADADIIAGREAGCFTIGVKIDGDKRIEELKELLEIGKIFK